MRHGCKEAGGLVRNAHQERGLFRVTSGKIHMEAIVNGPRNRTMYWQSTLSMALKKKNAAVATTATIIDCSAFIRGGMIWPLDPSTGASE